MRKRQNSKFPLKISIKKMSFTSNVFNFLYKFLTHTMVVHIYSSPNFAMESFMSLLMCMVHILLLNEINAMIKNVNMPPIKVRIREASPVDSRHSLNKSVLRNHPDLGVDILFKENHTCVKSEWDTIGKINKILSRTLSEYIRRDLKKMDSNIITEEPSEGVGTLPPSSDDRNSSLRMSSMEKMYDFLLQEPDVQRRRSKTKDPPSDKEVIRLH